MSDRSTDVPMVLAEAQRNADREAYAGGVASGELMESAGRAAAEWILAHVDPQRVLCLAGPGGNGGDALVVARYLAEGGIPVRVLFACGPDRFAADTLSMRERLPKDGVDVETLSDLSSSGLSATLAWPTHIVDGLFGSGLSRPVAGSLLELIRAVDEARVATISLDLPSGLASDQGAEMGEAVHADTTLAMEFLKPAHLLYPAAGHSRRVAVVDVAYPVQITARVVAWARVPTVRSMRTRLPRRRPDGHKGSFGRVLIVAGSPGMTGAAILACRGALRVGAGLVYLAAPEALRTIYEIALPEVICVPWPGEESGDRLSFDACLASADAVAIGPGLGRGHGTEDLVFRLVEQYAGRLIIDADGLTAFAARPEGFSRVAGRAIFTPHAAEFARLIEQKTQQVNERPRDAAVAFAETHGVVLLLKGRPTFVACPGTVPVANPTGNTGLATGGSGDVLTGMLAGLAASGMALPDAAALGAYVHGLAAEIYAREVSERSLLPTDLVDLIPRALREIEGAEPRSTEYGRRAGTMDDADAGDRMQR